MVELTSKPTDISKIQDIMNAISSNDSSDKTGLMVDYAAGSKLESNILALKGIAIQQAGYLKKMVEYQETMIGNARREDVSSVASASKKSKKGNNEEENRYDSLGTVLATAGSAGLLSLLGPLGLRAAAGMFFGGGAGTDKLAGGAADDKVNADADTNKKPTTDTPDADTNRPAPKFMRPPVNQPPVNPVSVDYTGTGRDFRLGTKPPLLLTNPLSDLFEMGKKPKLMLTKEMLAAISDYKGADFKLGTKPKPMLTKEMLAAISDYKGADFELGTKPTLQLTKEMRAAISGTSPLSLTEQMRVNPKISDAPTKGANIKGAGAAGALLSGGISYFDKELKDAGLTGIQRIGQGLLESIPGAIDMFTRGLITDPLNSFSGRGFAPEEDKFNLDVTPAFRKFMLAMGSTEVRQETSSDINTMLRQAGYDPMNPDRDRQRISPNAPDLYVPDKTLAQPPAAPIIIAPPSAPASSVVNSNNQQTTIVNQIKDVSASLYKQMLGGD